jgi:uncharacterized protein Yka (UPF0111/DUF47 family)
MGTTPAPEIRVKITGEDTGVAAAIKELSTQLQQLKRTQDDAGSSAQKLGAAERGAGSSMREAREGARLLSEETGVHLNRGLVSVISRSQTLGPLISAAFPIAAAIGFGEVLVQAAEKFSTMIADTFIFTAAMKQAYASQVAVNQEIAKLAADNKKLDEEAALIGLKGTERVIVQIRQKGDEIDKIQKKITDLENQRGAARLGLPSASTGAPITFGDQDQLALGGAQQQLKNAQEQQRNLELQAMADKADDDKEAAAKAKTLQDQINKARLAQIEAGFAGELELYKAQHAKLDQDNEANYVKGLESTAQYYAKKQQLAAEESRKEIDALTAERARVLAAPTKDGAEQIEQQTKAADLANKIAIARVNAEKVQQQLANEGAQKQEEENRKVLDFQAKIAEAQGLRFDEAKSKIAAEAEEMAAGLRKAGIAPDQIAAMVAQFKSAATQQAQFSSMKTTGQDAVANFTDQEEDIRLKNITIVADTKIKELEQTRIPILQQIAAQMKAAAITPEQIKDADEFAKSVDKIAIAAKNSSVSMQSFEQSASGAIQGDLTTFLGSTIDKAKGVGDAFRQLAGSVVGSIQKIVAALLVQIITEKLVQAITHQDQGATGVATAAAKGVAQAAPLIAASTAMGTAGGVISTAATVLGASAAALQGAADTLIIANSAGGGGVPAAGGGLITGPGSGTSDSIPARLSAGEFVIRAAAVQEIGVPALAMMNRGLHIPGIRGASLPRFAEGGLVTGGGYGGAMDLKLGLGLDQGLVLKHLESKAAGKVILQHISNNPKAAGKALQRGGH